MKRFILIFFLSISFVFNYSCRGDKEDDVDDMDDVEISDVEETTTPVAETEMKKVTLDLAAKSNSNVTGNAVFTEENGTVQMVAVMSGLTPGTHAIHLHETADCSAADATSSGGHWNPTGQQHGKWGDAAGYHRGDIGNFEANANGNATVRFETDQWCIGCDDSTKNILGKAVIVHKGADDYTSQPSGAAGDRVSCGGVIQ